MRYLCLVSVLLLITTAPAVSQSVWYKEYSNIFSHAYNEIKPTPDGGFIVAGHSGTVPFTTIRLLKINSDGSEKWRKELSQLPYLSVIANNISPLSGGGYVVGGAWFHDPINKGSASDLLAFPINNSGEVNWPDPFNAQPAHSYQDYETTISIGEASDGHFYFLGVTDVVSNRSYPSNFLKVSKNNGRVLVRTSFPHASSAVRQTPDGGYLVLGDTLSRIQDSIRTPVLTKLDGQGRMVWQKRYPNIRSGPGYMQTFPDGGAFFSCQYGFIRTDPFGNILWADSSFYYTRLPKTIYTTEPVSLSTGVAVHPDGRCTGVGIVREGPVNRIFIRWYAPDGTPQGTRLFHPFLLKDNPILPSVCSTADGGIAVTGFTEKGTFFVLKTNEQGTSGTVSGRVARDVNGNCTADTGEPPLQNWVVEARRKNDKATYYAITDSTGAYGLWLPQGNYEVEAIPPAPVWQPCSIGLATLNPQSNTATLHLPVKARMECPLLQVEMAAHSLRRGFRNATDVTVCNYGSRPALNTTVRLQLDELLTLDSITTPIEVRGNNVYDMPLGRLEVNQCVTARAWIRPEANAPLRQTLCMEAQAYNDLECTALTDWLLTLQDSCTGDSVVFTIANPTSTPMPQASEYIIVEDNVMRQTGQIQLDAGEFQRFAYAANGSTWTMQVQQNPALPGLDSLLIAVVEGCGAPVFTPHFGYYNQFALQDRMPGREVECRQVTSSFDPNDKLSFPEGYNEPARPPRHLIAPNTEIEYIIRFQNTGNDTAFTVVILDTLSSHLDPTSVRTGAASHPFQMEMTDGNALRFTFTNILLPDSTTDRTASNGYVKYRVRPRPNLPDNTRIENRAAIYFDFNEAITTNTTFHTISRRSFVPVKSIRDESAPIRVRFSPNPVRETLYFDLQNMKNTNDKALYLHVFRSDGQKMQSLPLVAGAVHLPETWTSGMYFFKLTNETQVLATGKFALLR